jgi:tetratricopeptide (TPR) repeat protein
MLLVLDNASSVEQVRPLLPGTPTCAVIVTSRDSLPGLVAVDGARRVDLDLLSTDEAVTLLRQLIGPRVDANPPAAADLAARCARLPLALRVAAELAVSRPAASVADLVAELERGQQLDLLDPGGDPRAAVRMVFSWSMRQLPPAAARTFALLGLHPGPDWDVHAAAALSGRPVPEVARTVGRLERAHLVHRSGNGRWAMHDLLRAYAADLAADLPAEGAAALHRMFEHYVGSAAAAADLLYPSDAPHRPESAPVPGGPALDGADAARAWLDAERAVLVATAAHGAEFGFPASVVELSTILFRHLRGGHLHDAAVLHGHAREAARRSGDRAGEALALHGLGTVQMLSGDPTAAAHLRGALELFRAVGDPVGQARALANLGTLEARHGRHGPAVDHHERAIELYRQAGDRTGEARTLGNLGILDQRMGSYERAAAHHAQALRLFRETGDRGGEAVSLNNLGAVESRLGRHAAALAHHEESLALCTAVGDRSGEAWALTALAEHTTRVGRPEEALERLRRALDVFRACGERDAEPWVQNSLGEATLASGDPGTALAHHEAALELAIAVDDRSQEARAHGGLARAHQALGRPGVARGHREQAIRRYDALGAPEADALRREAVAASRRRT